MTSKSSWKTGLLKTGLPLEYVASNILSNNRYEVFGQFPYIRPNENGDLKEFSIDIRAHKAIDAHNSLVSLDILAECKYRQPGTSWIFSPYPSDTMPIGLVQNTEDLSTVRLDSIHQWELERAIGYCINGVELDSSGQGKPDGSKHGIFQLRFAMPVLLKEAQDFILRHNWKEGQSINLLYPILITTADIRVIKPDLTLEDFTNSSDIESITYSKKAIIVNETPGPQLKDFANQLASSLLAMHPNLEQRLDTISSLLVGDEWLTRFPPDIDSIRRSFSHSTERVLIVNYQYLDEIIKKLEDAISISIEQKKIYGKLKKDHKGVYST